MKVKPRTHPINRRFSSKTAVLSSWSITAFGIKYSVSKEESIIAMLMAIYVGLVPAFSILMNWTCKSSTAFLVRSNAFLKEVPRADLIG